jgi:hypothetical protein
MIVVSFLRALDSHTNSSDCTAEQILGFLDQVCFCVRARSINKLGLERFLRMKSHRDTMSFDIHGRSFKRPYLLCARTKGVLLFLRIGNCCRIEASHIVIMFTVLNADLQMLDR